MIVLLDTSEALDVCAYELGCEVHQLVTPAPGFTRQKEHDWYSIDNGAFGGFNRKRFLSILNREGDVKHLCKFLVVPDIVADARRTSEAFDYWKYKLSGWPLAYAAQDGVEDLPIPWKQIKAIFIGGTTAFKLGEKAKACIRAGQAMGKWVHVGRVNTPGRFEYFEKLGVDSIDGTGLARYTHMREDVWKLFNQPNLLTGLAPTAEQSSLRRAELTSTAEIAPEITAGSGNDDDESDRMVLQARLADPKYDKYEAERRG
jgi:hypothetical protein